MSQRINERGIVILREDISPVWLNRMQASQLNVLGLHELPTDGNGNTEKMLEWLAKEENRALINQFEDAGISVEFELHTMSWLLPREEFAAHPDWFRMNEDGVRVHDHNCCPSSKSAMAVVKQNACKLAALLKQRSHRYYFWLDDTISTTCHCELCRGYSGSDQNILLMNEVLSGLREYDSEATLAYLAYADALTVPSVTPADGLFLEFAPMNRNHELPMNTTSDPANIRYAQLLRQLLTIFPPCQTHVLEYWLDAAMYSECRKPAVKVPFFPDVIKEDVQFYKGLGIEFITTFGSFLDEEYTQRHGTPPIREYGEILSNA